jgi:hypothetical protein
MLTNTEIQAEMRRRWADRGVGTAWSTPDIMFLIEEILELKAEIGACKQYLKEIEK